MNTVTVSELCGSVVKSAPLSITWRVKGEGHVVDRSSVMALKSRT